MALARAGRNSLLAERDFRLLWVGESVSTLGSQFHIVALAIVALEAGGGLALGLVLTAAAVPRAALMLVGGWVADRTSPRAVMLATNVLRGLLAAALAIVVSGDGTSVAMLASVALAFGAVDAFFLPAVNASVPLLVSSERLGSANAWLQGTAQLAAVVGPGVAGGVVLLVGPGPAFVIDAVSFVVAAAALVSMSDAVDRRHATARDAGAGLLDGVRYAVRDRAVGLMIALATIFYLGLSGAVSVGVPWLGENAFGGAAAVGALLAAWSGGALVGAGAAAVLDRRPWAGHLVLPVGLLVGLAVSSVAVAPNLPAAGVALAAAGIGGGLLNVAVLAWLQRRVDAAIRGRSVSLLVLGTVAFAPLSLALAGVGVAVAGRLVFTAAGGLIIAVALASLLLGAGRVLASPPPAGVGNGTTRRPR